MGKVYRARDSRLGAVCVAIEISRKRFSGRFEREARAIAALNHPRICTLYDVGPNYLVLEPVEGETHAAFDADVPKPLSEPKCASNSRFRRWPRLGFPCSPLPKGGGLARLAEIVYILKCGAAACKP